MNIAVVSPEKFKFQDLVCIDLMFRFRATAGAEFCVEPPGGEDGLLRVPGNGPMKQYEVQVKGSRTQVDLGAIALCLIHFPPRSSSDCLLERVYNDADRYAVLVFSGRCSDAASVYVADPEWAGEPHADSQIAAAVVDAFRAAFRQADPEGTSGGKLHSARLAHARRFIDGADKGKLREALKRVIVVELRRKDEVVARCCAAMDGIALDARGDILNRIRDHVDFYKAKGTDAYPQMRSILMASRQGDIRPAEYVRRGQEQAWIDELTKTRAILMSGRTRVGKSDAARFVAAAFAEQGYEVRQVFEAQAAERFLQERGARPRLVLLDDPLNFNTGDAAGALSLVDKLVRRLLPSQALIVAQGQETLLEVTGSKRVASILTAGRRWIDLSDCPAPFQEAVWRRQAHTMDVPETLAEDVSQALRARRLDLEPGCLTHLAAQHHRLHADPSVADYEKLAREDAQTLGRQLRKDGCERLLLALLVGTSAMAPIDLESLAFSLGAGGSKLPADKPEGVSVTTRGEAAKDVSRQLTYETKPVLSKDDASRVEYLETHRIVTVAADGIAFAHPFYRAAAAQAAAPVSAAAASRMTEAVRRTLFCASPRVSKAAARNLQSLYLQLADHPDTERREIISAAADAITNCRFIATRDLCLAFLIPELDRIPANFQERLPTWVSQVDVDLDALIWVDGEAMAFNGVTDMEDMFEMYRRIEKAEIAVTLGALRSNSGATPPAQEIAKLIRYFMQKPALLQAGDMSVLLAYDEAAVRAAAAKAWLSVGRANDDEILETIFADNHPSVARQAVAGCVRSWRALGKPRRELLQMGLAAACATPAAAAAVLPALTVFGRVEYTGDLDTTPWDLFMAIFPGVMRALPAAALYNDARSYGVVDEAIKRLPTAAALEAVDAMIDAAMQKAERGEVLSDFEGGVVTLLMRATASDPSLRADRVERLLRIRGTAAALRVVADLVTEWSDLRADEQAHLLIFLSGNRKDLAWLRAAAITRTEVPDEVAKVAAGEGVDLASADSIIEQLPEEVLSAAVRVAAGSPQPLWYIGTHHTRNTAWGEVIKRVALNGSHPAFDIAWEDLIGFGTDDELVALIGRLDDTHLDRVFRILLALKAHSSGDFKREVWAALFQRRDPTKIPVEWRDQIDGALPAIVDSLQELQSWFAKPYFSDARKLAQSDEVPFLLIDAAASIGKSVPAELVATTTETLLLLIAKAPPRLYKSCDALMHWFSKGSWKSDGAVALLQQRRAEIFEERKEIGKKYKFDPGGLHNWIRP